MMEEVNRATSKANQNTTVSLDTGSHVSGLSMDNLMSTSTVASGRQATGPSTSLTALPAKKSTDQSEPGKYFFQYS